MKDLESSIIEAPTRRARSQVPLKIRNPLAQPSREKLMQFIESLVCDKELFVPKTSAEFIHLSTPAITEC